MVSNFIDHKTHVGTLIFDILKMLLHVKLPNDDAILHQTIFAEVNVLLQTLSENDSSYY
jgi:hypothetical protein